MVIAALLLFDLTVSKARGIWLDVRSTMSFQHAYRYYNIYSAIPVKLTTSRWICDSLDQISTIYRFFIINLN